jgi:hypothetical protein
VVAGPPAPAEPPAGTEESFVEPSVINCMDNIFIRHGGKKGKIATDSLDVLALELGKKLLQSVFITVNADGLQDGLNIIS